MLLLSIVVIAVLAATGTAQDSTANSQTCRIQQHGIFSRVTTYDDQIVNVHSVPEGCELVLSEVPRDATLDRFKVVITDIGVGTSPARAKFKYYSKTTTTTTGSDGSSTTTTTKTCVKVKISAQSSGRRTKRNVSGPPAEEDVFTKCSTDDLFDVEFNCSDHTIPYSSGALSVTRNNGIVTVTTATNNGVISVNSEGEVTAPRVYLNCNMRGVCGNFDGDASNDRNTLCKEEDLECPEGTVGAQLDNLANIATAVRSQLKYLKEEINIKIDNALGQD